MYSAVNMWTLFLTLCVWCAPFSAGGEAPYQMGSDSLVGGVGALLPPFITNSLDDLLKAAAAACEVLPLNIIFSQGFTYEVPELQFVEYSREGASTYKVVDAHKRLRPQKLPQPLVIYVPGWWNSIADESTKSLVAALLRRHPLVLVLDTSASFSRGYVGAASRVKPIALLIYQFLKTLNQAGLDMSNVHIIGFSLGAHVAGMTGKLVKETKKSLGRITALDPAKPCFARPSDYRLGRKDARFVQVIHTSAGVLGLEQPVGHADVYVNGVSVSQPECRARRITLDCDHAQAWKLYCSSVMKEDFLMGPRCLSWQELQLGRCSGNDTALGYSCNAKTRGIFLHMTETAEARAKRMEKKKMGIYSPFGILTWLTG